MSGALDGSRTHKNHLLRMVTLPDLSTRAYWSECGESNTGRPRPKRGDIPLAYTPSCWVQNTKMRGQGMLLKAKAYETPRPLGSPHLCILNIIYH